MARAVRFIHAADTHLGAGFLGMRMTSLARSEMLRKAIDDAFEAVIDHAIDHEVDFICFAGDIYNGETKNLADQAKFRNGMSRLAEKGINAYVVGGNHDPIGDGPRLPLPPNVHVFDTEKVERVIFAGSDGDRTQTCAIYGRSYKTAEENTNFALGFKHDGDADNAIGILHTNVDRVNVGTVSAGERYARCSVADLEAAGMDYWALGHIHLPQVLKESDPMIVYSGSTQALQINETGEHGCELVTLDEGHASRERLSTGVVNFHHIEVDISECEDAAQLASAITDVAVDAIKNPTDRGRIIRVTLVGIRQFSLAELMHDPVEIIEVVDSLLNGALPSTYLDGKIVDETTEDPSTNMDQDANKFIRSILDDTYSDSMATLEEVIREGKMRKDAQKVDPCLLSEYGEGIALPDGLSESLIRNAKEQLYQMLSGRSRA